MSEFSDYFTVSGISVSESSVKGSRFFGIAMPCPDEEAIRSNLKRVQTDYPNATHYCYGAVFGGTNRSERSSDNGEPSGTAAKPILSVIRGNSLTDTMVVVVRYFGGTLLGPGGLKRAYTAATKEAVASAREQGQVVTMTLITRVTCVIPYSADDRVRRMIADAGGQVKDSIFAEDVQVTAIFRTGDEQAFVAAMRDFANGEDLCVVGEPVFGEF